MFIFYVLFVNFNVLLVSFYVFHVLFLCILVIIYMCFIYNFHVFYSLFYLFDFIIITIVTILVLFDFMAGRFVTSSALRQLSDIFILSIHTIGDDLQKPFKPHQPSCQIDFLKVRAIF